MLLCRVVDLIYIPHIPPNKVSLRFFDKIIEYFDNRAGLLSANLLLNLKLYNSQYYQLPLLLKKHV
jgi:hypothetical protein